MLMNNFLLKCGFKPKLNARTSLSIGIVLLLLLQSIATFAQKITLNYQNARLEQVLKEIRKQSGFDIFFDQNLVNQQPPIAVKINNASVDEAMSSALKDLPLAFAVDGKTISIKKTGHIGEPSSTQKNITISGIVVDENDIPRAGVSVSSGKLSPIYTNAQGKFTLKNIDPMAMVRISYTGFRTIERTALAISLLGKIHIETQAIDLDMTIIKGQKQIGSGKIDIRNRGHLSLAAVLESSVPGLVIRSARTTSSTKLLRVTGNDNIFPRVGDYTFEQVLEVLLQRLGGALDERAIRRYVETLFQGDQGYLIVENTTQTDYGVIPELRGAGGFGIGSNAMLIVIDGFVQESFPADYPMNNVLSVEVIRDPAETIKWGPRAINGVILITTNGGKSGKLAISYNSTFNFSAAPDNSRNALQLANTAQTLDYDRANSIIGENYNVNLQNGMYTPAQILLEKHKQAIISDDEFNKAWSVLAQNSNEKQFQEQQQAIFNQNQNLNLSGGGKFHNFAINGTYGTSKNELFGNSSRFFSLNLREQLSLIQNKLQIAVQVVGNQNRSTAGARLDPRSVAPYQMLYNPDGSYVYDFSSKSELNQLQNDQLLMRYPNLQPLGYNLLQEARGNRNLSKAYNLNSSLNIDWKVFPGFTWSANLQYINTKTNSENFHAADTRYVRGLYDVNYIVGKIDSGDPYNIINPRLAYVPLGDILQASTGHYNSTNLRTGFTYNKIFAQKHAIKVGLGLSAFGDRSLNQVDPAIYGYGSSSPGLNKAAFNVARPLIALDAFYTGPFGGRLDFSPLEALNPANKSVKRNLSTNAYLNYTYDRRLGLQSYYNESFIPVPSTDIYSSTRNYNAMAFWQINNESFFKVSAISTLKLSVGLGQIKMASLPVELPARRIFQPSWGTTALVITGFNPVRQNGEQINNYDGLLDLGLFNDALQAKLNYRYNSMGVKNQWSGKIAYQISKASYFKLPFVSNLMIEGRISNISPAQALAQMMNTNSPLSGGGFSLATGNVDLGALPPHITNKEIGLLLGLWKERVSFDIRYYNRRTSGMSNGTFQSDLSTGFSSRALYSSLVNKGYEFYMQAKILQGTEFTLTSTLNAAHNTNIAENVLAPNFDLTPGYLSVNRPGYAVGNLWSLRWAGLDNTGNPQVFDPNGNKVAVGTPAVDDGVSNDLLRSNANAKWFEYSGQTTPLWSGAYMQELGYKGFYVRATLRFALGHVMRAYRPDMSLFAKESSNLIAQRWRQPGDEAFTDIPTLSNYDYSKVFATKYSNNSILPADFVRLSDIQLSHDLPAAWLKGKYLKSLRLSLNLQNVALWTRNKQNIDPEAVSPDGRLLTRRPLTYGVSLNVGL